MSSQQFTCLIKEGSRDGQLKNAKVFPMSVGMNRD